MQKTAESGKKGEELAKIYLQNKGFIILHTNWRFSHSEIDIICKKEDIIVFVEVKLRTNLHFGKPETFVNKKKVEKMQIAANAYIEQNNWPGELRFDIISIEPGDVITHFEDAFY